MGTARSPSVTSGPRGEREPVAAIIDYCQTLLAGACMAAVFQTATPYDFRSRLSKHVLTVVAQNCARAARTTNCLADEFISSFDSSVSLRVERHRPHLKAKHANRIRLAHTLCARSGG